MLSELKLKTEAGSSRNACAINRGQEISDESDSESSNSSTDSNIKILEEKKILEKLIFHRNFKDISIKPNLLNLTKNWYSKPTPPDLQFEERFFQTQFSISTDKLYEWNIDGLSEEEILNKMNHMSMVANACVTNHDLSHLEIVDVLATRFSSTLRHWWDRHLTEDSRTTIRQAVKKNDEGLPIFGEQLVWEYLMELIL